MTVPVLAGDDEGVTSLAGDDESVTSGALTERESVRALRAAVAARKWQHAVDIIDVRWPSLMHDGEDGLDDLLRQIPVQYFRSRIKAFVVRDIRLQERTEEADRAFRRFRATLPEDTTTLDSIGASKSVVGALGTAAALMIAFRVRGQFDLATRYADVFERLGRTGIVHQTGNVAPRMPAGMLQVGIARTLTGDTGAAVIALQEAYETAHRTTARHVRRDAAGKLALVYALSGDLDVADGWLRRYRDASEIDGWLKPRVALGADLAAGLIAVDRLDRKRADWALARVRQGVDEEQIWGVGVSVLRSRFDLLWGDRHRALRRIGEDRLRYARVLSQHTIMSDLLDAVEVDLTLSLRQGHRASEIIHGLADNVTARIARARWKLLTGDLPGARGAIAVIEAGELPTRQRTEALALRVATEPTDAASQELMDAIDHTGALWHLAALPAAVRDRASAEDVRAAEPLDLAREMFPAEVEFVALTGQENEMLACIAQNKKLKQIAQELHLSPNTVKTHMRTLYTKLRARNRTEALAAAGRVGLLDSLRADEGSGNG